MSPSFGSQGKTAALHCSRAVIVKTFAKRDRFIPDSLFTFGFWLFSYLHLHFYFYGPDCLYILQHGEEGNILVERAEHNTHAYILLAITTDFFPLLWPMAKAPARSEHQHDLSAVPPIEILPSCSQ
jgi:hypothetical protein